MLNDDNQDVDFDNNEAETEEVFEEVEDTEEDTTDWKAEALKYENILDRNKNKKADEKPASKTKSDDFGYDVKAYLKSSGINASEFEFVRAEVKASGQDVDSLLENEYFQAKLEKHRELTKTADATIKGKRSNAVATDSIDYWMAKPFEEVPQDMRSKVLNAKLAKDSSKGKFYNS